MPPSQVRVLCEKHRLGFVQMALPAGDPSPGEKGLAGLPGREEEFRESVAAGVHYARECGSRHVHVMSGVRPQGATVEDVWPTYIGNQRHACSAAAKVGMPVLIEPIGVGTLEGCMLDTPGLALRALKEVDAPNLSILFDAFHARNADIDPVAFVREHHAVISHVHIADHPGRHEPGTGSIDFHAFLRELDAVGYAGG